MLVVAPGLLLPLLLFLFLRLRLRLCRGQGVVSNEPVERLYREIRALRIYEGATEVQQLIIARELLKSQGA